MIPVVLVHGFCGFDRVRLGGIEVRYFGEIGRAIERRGHAIHATRTPPMAPVARRAEQLADQVRDFLRDVGADRAVIVAHSMGGLDARYMIARLGMARHVAALLTVATPHRGTAQADFWVDHAATRHFAIPLLEALGVDSGGARDLTTAAAERFNADVPDHPAVRYFSVSAACPEGRVPLLLRGGYRLLRRREGDNDAMVSVRSATWGTHLGTWPVHHMESIGSRFPEERLTAPQDVPAMYVRALDRLAEAGVEGMNALAG